MLEGDTRITLYVLDDADDEDKLMEAAGLQDEIHKMEAQSPEPEMEEIIP
jgi:hypothetical protein